MATTNSSKRPATTLRCGNIKATIWQSASEGSLWPSGGFLQHHTMM